MKYIYFFEKKIDQGRIKESKEPLIGLPGNYQYPYVQRATTNAIYGNGRYIN